VIGFKIIVISTVGTGKENIDEKDIK